MIYRRRQRVGMPSPWGSPKNLPARFRSISVVGVRSHLYPQHPQLVGQDVQETLERMPAPWGPQVLLPRKVSAFASGGASALAAVLGARRAMAAARTAVLTTHGAPGPMPPPAPPYPAFVPRMARSGDFAYGGEGIPQLPAPPTAALPPYVAQAQARLMQRPQTMPGVVRSTMSEAAAVDAAAMRTVPGNPLAFIPRPWWAF